MYNIIILLATLSFGVIGRFRKASKQNFKVRFQNVSRYVIRGGARIVFPELSLQLA